MSWVVVKVPCAPQPLACILRSGMTSRSKCARFSISQMSWSRAGPRRPAVKIFVLSGTGAPVALVKCSGFDIMNSQFQKFCYCTVVYESIVQVKGHCRHLAAMDAGHLALHMLSDSNL